MKIICVSVLVPPRCREEFEVWWLTVSHRKNWDGVIQPMGRNLLGWISKRVTQGSNLNDLTRHLPKGVKWVAVPR